VYWAHCLRQKTQAASLSAATMVSQPARSNPTARPLALESNDTSVGVVLTFFLSSQAVVGDGIPKMTLP
jgi:hypothetical protein